MFIDSNACTHSEVLGLFATEHRAHHTIQNVLVLRWILVYSRLRWALRSFVAEAGTRWIYGGVVAAASSVCRDRGNGRNGNADNKTMPAFLESLIVAYSYHIVPKIVVTIVHLAAMHSTALVSTGSGRPCQRRLDGICGMVFRRGLPGCRRPKPYFTECFAGVRGSFRNPNTTNESW